MQIYHSVPDSIVMKFINQTDICGQKFCADTVIIG